MEKKISNLKDARKYLERRIEIKKFIIDLLMMTAAVFSAGFGLKGFLIPNHFIDGGSTGLSLLISNTTKFSFSLFLILINIPFILMGKQLVSLPFAIKTGIAIFALSILVAFFPYPMITNDKLLIAVFGGFFLGSGIGLAIRAGCVIDGTEILAIITSKKTGLSIGDIIMAINIFIFSLAAWMIDIETALYAMLTYLSASKTVDFIIDGIEEYIGVTIISPKAEKIKLMITQKMERGFTTYKGEGGFGKSGEKKMEQPIIQTIVTRLEVNKLKLELEKIDPNAFVFMSAVKDMKGGMIKKRRMNH